MPILPIVESPYKSYLHEAHTYNVLLAYPQYEGWIHENCVQLRWADNWLFTYVPQNIYTGMPYLYQEWIDLDTILEYNIDVVDLIKKSIDAGQYVATYVNESYISEIGSSLPCHNTLVYGYDDSTEKFMIMGFGLLNKYGPLECSYDDFKSSYINVSSHKHCNTRRIIKFKPFQYERHEFNLINLGRWLSEYLNSTNSDYRISAIKNSCFMENAVWGISCYEEIIKYIEDTVKLQKWIDIRIVYALWDHKVCMGERLKYLKKYCYLDNLDDLILKYNDVVNDSNSLRNAILKYNMTLGRKGTKHNPSVYKHIIYKIKENEISVLKKVLEMIQNKPVEQNWSLPEPQYDVEIPASKINHASVALTEDSDNGIKMSDGDWFVLRGVRINEEKQKENIGIGQVEFLLKNSGNAKIELRLNSFDGICIGETTIEKNETEHQCICTCTYELPIGIEYEICKRDLYVIVRLEEGTVEIKHMILRSVFCVEKSRLPAPDISRKNYAVKYSQCQSIKNIKDPSGQYHVAHIQYGATLKFNDIDFYKSVKRVFYSVSLYKKEGEGYIDMYVDDLRGKPISTCKLEYTGEDRYYFKTFGSEISSELHGKHTIYFVFRAKFCSINYFWFK